MIVLKGYEMPVVVKGSLDESKGKAAVEEIKKLITDAKGEVADTEDWGKKNLQYPIKKEKSAYYVLINFEADQKTIPGLNRRLRLLEDLLRFLIIKKEPVKKMKVAKATKKKAEA
jgi:small subunit ribosomal protein S6